MKRAGLVWIVTGVLIGVLIVALVLIPEAIVAFSAIFLVGVLIGFAVTTWLSIVQIIVPNEMQGRYFGIDQLGSLGVIPVGQIIGGLAIAAFGISWTYGIAGAGIVLTTLPFLASADLRKLGYSKPQERQTVASQAPAGSP